MITAKQAKEMMPDAHIKYKKDLLEFTVSSIERSIKSSVEKFNLVTTVNINPLIRKEVTELLKENGYTIRSNGPDELTIDWSNS